MLWGIRLVRTGIMRAFGSSFRHYLGAAIGGRMSSFGVGLGITVFLQSSTATALIVSSFAAKGMVQTPAALAVMLGADIGTTISAQILSFDLSWLAYALIFVGFFLHSRSSLYTRRQVGRVILGLGLVLLALSLVRSSSQPLRDSDLLVYILSALEREMFLTMFILAVLTWLVHSSLAVVLLTASLATSGVVPVGVGVVMILGANIGGTIPPIIATMGAGPHAQHAAIGNAAFKFIACLLVLPFLPYLTDALRGFAGNGQILVHVHTAFNVLVALLFLPWVGTAATLLKRAFPNTEQAGAEPMTRYLDKELIRSPTLALSSATRELYRINEQIELTLDLIESGISDNELHKGDAIKVQRARVSAICEELILFLTDVTREEISESDNNKAMSLLLLSTNLRHVSDLLDNAVDICATRAKEQNRFSDEGTEELLQMLELIRQGLHLVLPAALQKDPVVRKSIQKKRKELERLIDHSRLAHFTRLGHGSQSAINTTTLHNELLRDFSQVFNHIFMASKIEV